MRSLQLSNSITSVSGQNTETDDFDHDRRSCSPMNDSLQHTPSLRHCLSIDSTTACEGQPNLAIHTYDYPQDQPTPTVGASTSRRSESSMSSSHVLVGRGAVSLTNQSNPMLTIHRQISNSELCSECHHTKKIQSNRSFCSSILILDNHPLLIHLLVRCVVLRRLYNPQVIAIFCPWQTKGEVVRKVFLVPIPLPISKTIHSTHTK